MLFQIMRRDSCISPSLNIQHSIFHKISFHTSISYELLLSMRPLLQPGLLLPTLEGFLALIEPFKEQSKVEVSFVPTPGMMIHLTFLLCNFSTDCKTTAAAPAAATQN